MTEVDFLVRAGVVVTMNVRRELIRDAAVVVDKGAIVAVGKAAELEARYRARKVLGLWEPRRYSPASRPGDREPLPTGPSPPAAGGA